MTKRMLIDATHSEETRVAVVDGNRLVEFDYESKVRKQLKGSIFLAKVTRVEPSLQAAFVNFGGNRHGFLPFSEVHPDYYRIPIADREALLAEQEAEMEARRLAEEAADREEDERAGMAGEDGDEPEDVAEVGGELSVAAAGERPVGEEEPESPAAGEAFVQGEAAYDPYEESSDEPGPAPEDADFAAGDEDPGHDEGVEAEGEPGGDNGRRDRRRGRGRGRGGRNRRAASGARRYELVDGEDSEDYGVRPSARRNYKIQEVVKRGQIMLVQASKEERGNKGAAVTTYLSLPGRYCVLMPNSPRGGGVSRKIASFSERRRMRELLSELEVPAGMSVIVRTAGVSRTKVEIKRDLDYLLRLWDEIRETTLRSTAPSIIHEEGNLIRRSIRDIYTSEIEDVLVAGDDGYKFARDFMKMMIPSHAKRVKQYADEKVPLFNRYQIESQISEIGQSTVTLRSGGYLVINPTEALVSIDVNSGRATKERHIEETALKTNLEAAEEVSRQLRLRDLGGLVVIDFIDMEDRRNNRRVEERLKQALSTDRARIQVGRISSFGLLELSRQRLNPSLTEAQYEKCPHCLGIGVIRTVDSAAILALRALEEEGSRARASEATLFVRADVALYIFNNKREMVNDLERRYGFRILIQVDETVECGSFRIETVKGAPVPARDRAAPSGMDEDDAADDDAETESEADAMDSDGDESGDAEPADASDERRSDEQRSGRRRGRRGGRRRRGGRDQSEDRSRGDDDYRAAEPQGEVRAEEGEASDEGVRRQAPRRGRRRFENRDREAAGDNGGEERAENQKRDEPYDFAATPERAPEPPVPELPAPPAIETAPAGVSNDDAPARTYERVNETPSVKKRGWWNKLKE